jgi:hypothetical protein
VERVLRSRRSSTTRSSPSPGRRRQLAKGGGAGRSLEQVKKELRELLQLVDE